MDNNQKYPGRYHELEAARLMIENQRQQITELRERISKYSALHTLHDAFILAITTRTIVAPSSYRYLLEVIVDTATKVIAANAGSLFLIDQEAQELVFEVAIGGEAEEVKELRLPLGHGIAGLVALTGQPMAVSDAADNPLQASDIARTVGYIPHSIICVPLYYREHIIGVLELLDKQGAEAFTEDDVNLLGIFAHQAGVAIEQSRTYQHLTSLFAEAIHIPSPVAGLEEQRAQLQAQARAFMERIESEDSDFKFALSMASLIQEIAGGGEREKKLCQDILGHFASYIRFRTHQDDFLMR